MLGLSRTRRPLWLALVGFVTSIQLAHGQNKSEPVNFETGDGVKIVGTFWASNKGKKAPVVMLLHDFHVGKGGNSHADGWDALAEALNKDGYAVLSFDFRGHGNSKSVNATFWTHPHNRDGMKTKPNPSKLPETIDHAGFVASYFPQLVNDIAAAKAFLDRKNDGAELNSSNVIVIGAGEGATLGAMYMYSDWFKARASQAGMGGVPMLNAQTEGKDQVCAIWLDISPTIAGSGAPVSKWLTEIGRKNKVAMGFIYGKEVQASQERTGRYLTAIVPNFKRGTVSKEPGFEFTNEQAMPTKLTGSQLLNKNLDTEKFIVNDYIKAVIDKHQVTEWRSKDSQTSGQYWVFPNTNPYKAKNEGELAPLPLPLQKLMQ